MTPSRRARATSPHPGGRIPAALPRAGRPEDALPGTRDEHEQEVRAWITDLTSTSTWLRQEPPERERLEADGRRTERSLREVQQRFESAFDNAPIGMALIAMDGRWLQVNDALCRITGRTAEELKATTLPAITHVDDVDIDAQSLTQLLAGQVRSYQVEKRLRHAWGHDIWVLVTTSVVYDEERNPLHVVTQVQDISERKALARHLEYVVDHDFLTGLFNRRHFERALARETARAARYGAPGAVLLVDLDNFKDVNDTFGHRAGDDGLKGVAGLLRHRLRHTDVIARLGGDEFAVLLTQTDADHAQNVADEVVKALGRETAVLADRSIRVTASVGVALLAGLTDVEALAARRGASTALDVPIVQLARERCGQAALAMVLRYYGAAPDALREVDSAYPPVLRDSSIADLAAAARRAGYEAAVATLGPDSLIDLLADGVPPILLHRSDSTSAAVPRFGVVTAWDAAQAAFTLHDGGECPRVTPLGDLVEQWETAGSLALIVRQRAR